jgi:putative molybdopterin biosynthesis protein
MMTDPLSPTPLPNPGAGAEPRSLLTTAEVADYLRVKERTVYDLVARDAIPYTRVTGKLLFSRRLVDAWLESQTTKPQAMAEQGPPAIYAGSNDPLLEWSIRQSGSGLAVLAGGSGAGLRALAGGKAMLAGCHLRDPESGGWNVSAVRAALPLGGHVLIHWAKRTQGLLVAAGNPLGIGGLADAVQARRRFARRVEGAGSEQLLGELLAQHRLSPTRIESHDRRAETHADLAALIETGCADCGIGLQAAAGRLGFLPLLDDEHFDLAMPRRLYFEPPVQALLGFTRSSEFRAYARHLGGYAVSEVGAVRWNS